VTGVVEDDLDTDEAGDDQHQHGGQPCGVVAELAVGVAVDSERQPMQMVEHVGRRIDDTSPMERIRPPGGDDDLSSRVRTVWCDLRTGAAAA
jgi:hypothetical protein